MRCAEITRELVTPTGAVDPAGLARHLASCASCARHAEQAHHFDRIWEATQPSPPSADAFDEIWADVQEAADAARQPATIPFRPAAPARWAPWLAVAAVAQAAAVLIAAMVLLQDRQAETSAPVQQPQVAQVEFDLDEGQTLFLQLDERGDRVVCHPRFVNTAELVAFDLDSPEPEMLALSVDLLNGMESIQ